VQEPGALGDRTGGDRGKVPALARAAVATGHVDGVFFETHPDPDRSPSDGPNMIKLGDFERVLDGVLAVHAAARMHAG
jgi:2-dehydro-3-deoxyphosphooctonate aldolase (KDO 8-P synthase)